MDFFKYIFALYGRPSLYSVLFYPIVTGGHFACTCVHPLNDNSVGA